MALLDKLLGSVGLERRGRAFDEVIAAIDGAAGASDAGVVVNELTALQVSTVMACTELISRDVASLPTAIKKRERDGSATNIRDTREFVLLNRKPNPWQTAYELKEQLTAHAVLRGNAYAFKVLAPNGKTLELWPLKPSECVPDFVAGNLKYTVSAYEGRFKGTFEKDQIFHLRGLSWDGVKGMDRLVTAKQAIGLSSALEGSQAASMKNGARIPGILTTDNSLKPEQIIRIAEGWKAATTGKNAFKTPVLDGGFKFLPTALNSVDAQMIETRKHQVIEVCASFGVLPAILGVDDKTQSFASVEAMMRWHLSHTLKPYLIRWEQAIDNSILDGLGPMFCEFDTREFQKASTKERAEAYRTLVELGIMTRNEARELEGLAPLPGGDEPLTPMNMNGSESSDSSSEDGANDAEDEEDTSSA